MKSAIITDVKAQPAVGNTMEHISAEGDGAIKKPARRRTVYIPSEDTTMPTIWMGVFSPIKGVGAGDENSVGDGAADLTGIAAQMAKKRASRKSIFSAAPRRAPLSHSERPPQEATMTEDVPGRMTGKENIPPGHETTGKKKAQKKFLGDSSCQPQVARPPTSDYVNKPRPASYSPQSLSLKASCSLQPAQNGRPHQLQPRVSPVSDQDINCSFSRLRLSEGKKKDEPNSHSNEGLRMPAQLLSAPRTENCPTKVTVPNAAKSVLAPRYPLLSGDVQNSSLYENNWLAYQEIAITQLVNNLLDSSQGSADTAFDFTTRSQLLTMYQDQSFVFLQKRLQASLLYGTLALPKEVSAKSCRLTEDLGLKHNFLNLWLNVYNLQVLEACAEVVIGRECTSSPKMSSKAQISVCSPQKTTSRQNLSRYLETFLNRNEDSNPDTGMPDPGTTGLQHTLLRSLMLIKVLDTTKTSTGTPLFSGCLFQASSPYKSSAAVVQALAQMLHPAAGNIMRSLSHLSYSVSHIQYPLEEYNYHITNLAVDLRDGVRLTRLVEQLLFPSGLDLPSHASNGDTTTTITLPTGEILSLTQGDPDRPLSQHLKLPCLSRATKLFNVQLALTTLSSLKPTIHLSSPIQASHIVDGFRENTLSLLWSLTSQRALPSLIDWADLKRETARLQGPPCGGAAAAAEHGDELTRSKALLKAWASAAASRKGLRVDNLSTSFADGSVFEVIVDEYEPYLRASGAGCAPRQLAQRLAGLGCSAQFGECGYFRHDPSGPPHLNLSGIRLTFPIQLPSSRPPLRPESSTRISRWRLSRSSPPASLPRPGLCGRRSWFSGFGVL
jgi:abnormal spindle-like microcephaly-associated protein